MNELTKKLQQVMVPKAALIAYEYSDGRYGHGTYYLELHPINDRGRMEAAVPLRMNLWTPLWNTIRITGRMYRMGKSPPICCGAIHARDTRGTSGTILRENGRCSFPKG